MNKFLVLAFTLLISSSAFAQTNKKEMNKEYGYKYKEISTNPNLSGYEKGQKKRELALKQRQENLDYYNDHRHDHNSDLRDRKKKEIEHKIDRLEDAYKRDKDRIENNDFLSKREKNIQKRMLEKKFKNQKYNLKKEKDAIK